MELRMKLLTGKGWRQKLEKKIVKIEMKGFIYSSQNYACAIDFIIFLFSKQMYLNIKE